jgi:hypothetical protein
MRKRRNTRAVARWLRTEPWTPMRLPDRLRDAPSMLTAEEREMLRILAAEHPLRRGCVIDAGCFLGGSTLALALGMRERDRPVPVHTYDRFILDRWSLASYPHMLAGLSEGDNFRDRFEQQLSAELELATVHEGDVLDMVWDGEPIEILFIDIAKSWEISDHIHREWLPALVPGTGVLIQQDYVHEWCPWLHVLMELLAEHFESIATVGGVSRVFQCRSAVPLNAIPRSLRELPQDRLLALFDRSANRFSGEDRAVIECARAVLLAELGQDERARRHLDGLARSGAQGERFPSALDDVTAYVA